MEYIYINFDVQYAEYKTQMLILKTKINKNKQKYTKIFYIFIKLIKCRQS